MNNTNSTVRDLFLSLQKQRVLFCQMPGNGGDCLIAAGTIAMFEETNLDYVYSHNIVGMNLEEFDVLLISGGGNLVPLYSDTANVLDYAKKRCKRIILLPTTVRGHEDLLRTLESNVEIYCRETVTLDYLRSLNLKVVLHLDDDMAFNIKVDEFLRNPNRPSLQLWLSYFRQYIRFQKRRLGKGIGIKFRMNNGDHLLCIRMDREATEVVYSESIDLPLILTPGLMTKPNVLATAALLLKILDRYRSVETNRLHISIGAGLLNKKVVLLPNSYGKNESVYNHSINRHLKTVAWKKE